MNHLRTISLATLAGGLLSLTACDKDNDDGFTRDQLVGSWEVTSGEQSLGFIAGGQTGDETAITIDSSSATATFNEDGTYALSGPARHTLVTYPGTDSAQTTVYVADLNNEGTFFVEGMTVMAINRAGEEPDTFAFEVERFAAGELLELESAVESTTDFFGVEVGTVVRTSYVLEK